MLRRFEGLYLEYVCLIYRSMVKLDVILENVRDGGFLKDCLPRAFRFARTAVDAFVGMDIEHIGEIFVIVANVFVNTIDRADADTSGIDAINAEPGYRPWHKSKSSPYVAPFSPLLRLLGWERGGAPGCGRLSSSAPI
jgi:hypothetical protein